MQPLLRRVNELIDSECLRFGSERLQTQDTISKHTEAAAEKRDDCVALEKKLLLMEQQYIQEKETIEREVRMQADSIQEQQQQVLQMRHGISTAYAEETRVTESIKHETEDVLRKLQIEKENYNQVIPIVYVDFSFYYYYCLTTM